jgi:hypothetical protein
VPQINYYILGKYLWEDKKLIIDKNDPVSRRTYASGLEINTSLSMLKYFIFKNTKMFLKMLKSIDLVPIV